MTVGVLLVRLRIHGCDSLKVKRMHIRPILDRARHKFHVAVAEVGQQDVHDRAELAFVTVSSSDKIANSTLDKMLNFIDSLGLAELLDHELELIRY